MLTRFQEGLRSLHNCKFTDFSIVTIIILVIGSFAFGNVLVSNAYAQAPPLLPPPNSFSSSSNNGQNLRIAPNDTNPPKVEILSSDFTEGNNRVFVIVTDESDLRSLEVRYVNNGDIVSADLIKDKGDQYFGLVKLQPPSAVLDFEITDAANNTASIAKEFKVSPQGNIFDQLWAWFKGFLSNFGLS